VEGIYDRDLCAAITTVAVNKGDNIVSLPPFLLEVTYETTLQIVIMDCCHSASGTRALRDQETGAIRGIELHEAYTKRASLTEKDFQPKDGSNTSRAASSTPHNYVLLAACREDELAGDDQVNKRGHFTHRLLEELAAAESDWRRMTYAELIGRVGKILRSLVIITFTLLKPYNSPDPEYGNIRIAIAYTRIDTSSAWKAKPISSIPS
jgi:hypothetical protein